MLKTFLRNPLGDVFWSILAHMLTPMLTPKSITCKNKIAMIGEFSSSLQTSEQNLWFLKKKKDKNKNKKTGECPEGNKQFQLLFFFLN